MAACVKCNKELVVEISPDSDSDTEMDASEPSNTTETFPDEVKLSCGCKFHFECLIESYELEKCPNCARVIVSAPQAGSNAVESIMVDVNNEGGLSSGVDLFPILKEESYLRAYPDERKCRAFLEFCREGNYQAIAELVLSCSTQPGDDDDEEEEEEEEDAAHSKSADEILRYQDPIGDMASGLHLAAANGHREVAWLLLLLASSFPELEIPAEVYQEAAALGIMRGENVQNQVDIRSLKDANGRTAEDIAREEIIWTGWIGNGKLALPE